MRVIGKRVQLGQKIASGGMGDVYRGQHLVTGADVAVKVLEPSAHPDDDAIERFRTEARVSAVLQHRSIVRVFDLLEEKDGTLALVMELLVGQTLEKRLAKDGPLDPEIAVAITLPILGALDHAHAATVVHRDVKPANVFLAVEPDGRVTPKLLDFGVAKSDASTVKTMDGHILGTARYVSPEQARGEPLDGRSDLFSMGVLLYEAITGESPFAAPDASRALRNVIERVVDAHERIPPRLWLVIQKALAKQPYARYGSAGAMAKALVTAMGKEEEELAKLLVEERPPLPRIETPVIAITSVRGGAGRRRVWPFVAGGAAIGLGIAWLALTHLPGSQKASVASAPPPKTAESSAPIAPATTAPPQPIVTVHTLTSAAPEPTPPKTHTQSHTAPTVTASQAKPIATTPGF